MQLKPMQSRIVAALLLTLSAGCVGLQQPDFPAATPAPSSERAQALLARGDHAQAAAMYEALAMRAAAGERNALLLTAARSWLNATRTTDAARVLGLLGTGLSTDQTTQRRILDAEIALANGQAQQAWTRIAAVPEPAGGAQAIGYLDARMRIAVAAARPVDAVRAEIAAERHAADATQRSRLRSQLLAQLRVARERGVKLEPATSQDGVVRGWLDLGAIAGNVRGVSLTSSSEAQRWRARYPGHPATELLNEALPPSLSSTGLPNSIALLLPVSRSDAQLVRDGFRYAIEQLPVESRPTLRIYDTTTAPVAGLLLQARAEGAQFIVGPLTREEVTAAAEAGTPPAPMLALNFLAGDRGGPNGFYQFALSPEDEARAVARRILASGQRRGVAIAPTGDWGNRVLAAFTQELQAGRGVLLAQASYDPSTHDYGEQIKLILGTADSEARLRRVQAVTGGKLEFEPRRRTDLDFIFAPGMSTNARLLRPQLRFHYAGDVPIYATSAAFVPGAGSSNRDLEGVIFPDMPWLLPDGTVASLKQDAAQSAGSGWDTRLFAFGYDSCQLALAIAGSGGDPRRVLVSGLTGQLSVDQGGRVRRDLQWARISGGEPQLLGAPAAPN